jgi:hypothetical protein
LPSGNLASSDGNLAPCAALTCEDRPVSQPSTTPTPNLGFLTVLHEVTGYLGGYLVTNLWGRPLEFRLSSAVQPNRIQQILYGGTLQPYICADLIGKTLVDKTSTAVQVVFTDRQAVLDLRLRLDVPVAWVAALTDPPVIDAGQSKLCVRPAGRGHGPILCHPQFPADLAPVRELLDRLDSCLDLTEPFARVREAVAEARKMGVTNRA